MRAERPLSPRSFAVALAAAVGLSAAAGPRPARTGPVERGRPDALSLSVTLPRCTSDPAKPTRCLLGEAPALLARHGVRDRVLAALRAAGPGARVHAASFAMSDPEVQNALCQKAREGVEVEAFVDRGNVSPALRRLEADCAGPGGRALRLYRLGGSGGQGLRRRGGRDYRRVQHVKAMMVEEGPSAGAFLLFGSGNLTTAAFSYHAEDFTFAHVGEGARLARAHRCLFDALRAAASDDDAGDDDPDAFESALSPCMRGLYPDRDRPEGVEAALAEDGIVPFFAPPDGGAAAAAIERLIAGARPGERLSVASEYFTHRALALALAEASRRGAAVSLLMDDDVLTSPTEPHHAAFYRDLIEPEAPALGTRFMATRRATGFLQAMHAKVLIAGGPRDEDRRVVVGAAQMSTSGFALNYENMYLVADAAFAAEAQRSFDAAWALSSPPAEATP